MVNQRTQWRRSHPEHPSQHTSQFDAETGDSAHAPAIKGNTVPYTILRATRRFDVIGKSLTETPEGYTFALPTLIQPIAADDVALYWPTSRSVRREARVTMQESRQLASGRAIACATHEIACAPASSRLPVSLLSSSPLRRSSDARALGYVGLSLALKE